MDPETAQHIVGQYQQWLAQSQHQTAVLQAENHRLREQLSAAQAPDEPVPEQ